ncbi:ABC transporter permease [Arthrobacter castelli]|uniref:ABC transporter permease n=1 Tax=Arthrobacter castelli TaxID=271431 RepID=UPI0003FC1DEA|nr:ABC transporter permease [Arthrobacter castelli]
MTNTSTASTPVIEQDARTKQRPMSKRRLVLRRFIRNVPADIGVVIFTLLVLLAVFGPYISPWEYDELDFMSLTEPPSAEHWLGTDVAGADMFALAVRGLGKSLMIGVIASLGTSVIAAIVGTSIAYFRGWVERVGMWLIDMLLAIPSFLLLAMIVSAFGSGANGWLALTFALMIFGWFGYARVLRSMTLSLREREYVQAAKYMGVPSAKVITRHLIPNLGSILIIQFVLGVVVSVLAETGLSFLGFGIQPPDTSLGVLIQEGSGTLLTAPWMLLVPMALLVALTFSMTLIGDGLRDALDPTSQSGGKA